MKFVVVVIACVGIGRAESVCLWLNAATAGGVLGGPVTMSVKPGVCEFVRESNKGTLHIEVQKKPLALSAKCESAATPLMAMGNEAVACSMGDTQMVIGRVRDQRFLVWIRGNDQAKEKIRKVAEQVAGSLF